MQNMRYIFSFDIPIVILGKIRYNLIGNLDYEDINKLHREGFTVREIEKLKGESKSTVARKLNREEN